MDENDIVLQLLPQTVQNRERTRTLSRVHCRLRRAGGAWVLTDQGSTYGTYVDDRRLRAGEEVRLEHGHTLSAGPWMKLRFTSAGVDAAMLQRVGNLADAERYLLVERAVTVGSAADDLVHVEAPGVDSGQARLSIREGRWHIEALKPGVRIGDREVPTGHPVRLPSGARFQLGTVVIEIRRG